MNKTLKFNSKLFYLFCLLQTNFAKCFELEDGQVDCCLAYFVYCGFHFGYDQAACYSLEFTQRSQVLRRDREHQNLNKWVRSGYWSTLIWADFVFQLLYLHWFLRWVVLRLVPIEVIRDSRIRCLLWRCVRVVRVHVVSVVGIWHGLSRKKCGLKSLIDQIIKY